MCLDFSPGISLPFLCAKLHFPAFFAHTQPVASNPIRCSHLLFYSIGLFSFKKQHDLFHSAAALNSFFSFFSYVPMEWGSGFVLHMLSERVIHKDSLLSKESSEPVRKEMMNHASQRGRVRHIKNDNSAVIPQRLELSWYVFPGNCSSFQAFIFSVKEWS